MIQDFLKIEQLPEDLNYPKGEISVIPDPKDREMGLISIYLINDTDQP